MQGVFVRVNGGIARPKSKKQIKELVKANPEDVALESTSMFGSEYDGPVTGMPEGQTAYFVGPDPYTRRKFYGQIKREGDKVTVL